MSEDLSHELEDSAEDTGSTPTNIAYHISEVENNARNSMDFLAGLAVPEVCTSPFPPVFIHIWNMFITALLKPTRDFSKFAIGLPRGHGKTIVLKILILFIILFTKKKFVLIVCASKDLAESIIADVVDMLDSDNIQTVFGNWNTYKEVDRQDKKKFHFRGRDIILAGAGSGSTLRGLNLKFARPDVMICDDLQTKEQAASEVQSVQLMKWFTGTLMKAKSPAGCSYIYVGNMYPDIKIGGSNSTLYTCILRNLQNNPNWRSWIVGGVLADGTALWEEVQPIAQLLEELEDDILMGCAEVFYSEVLNDPTCGNGKYFDISKLPTYDVAEEEVVVGKYIIIDPSLGKKKSDAQQVGLFYIYADSPIPVCKKLINMQVSAPKLVEKVIELAISENVPLVIAEAVAYQGSLLQWFDHHTMENQISGINFRGMTPGGASKNSRILRMFKALMEGNLKISPLELAKVLGQISIFDPLKQNNTDDILDVLAYAIEVPMNFPEELLMPIYQDITGADGQGVVEDSDVF